MLVQQEEDFSTAAKNILSLPNQGNELPPSFTIPTLLLGDEFAIVKERLENNVPKSLFFEYAYSLYRLGHYAKVLTLLDDPCNTDIVNEGIQFTILKAQVLYRLNNFPSSLQHFQKALTAVGEEDPELKGQLLVNCEAINSNIINTVDQKQHNTHNHHSNTDSKDWELLWNQAIRLKLEGNEEEMNKVVFLLRELIPAEEEDSLKTFIKELEEGCSLATTATTTNPGFRQSMTQRYLTLLEDFNNVTGNATTTTTNSINSNNRRIKRNLVRLLQRLKKAGLPGMDDPLYKMVYSLLYKQCERMSSLQTLKSL